MSRLFAYLLAFLRLGAGDAEPPVQGVEADPGGTPPADTAAGEGDDLDSLLSLDAGDAEVPRETPEPDAAAEARARADRLERELQVERGVNQRLAHTQSSTPSRDPQYEAEEAQLAEARRRGMAENDIYWLQFGIDTKRANRRTEATAAAALREAKDVSDATTFNQLAITKPALHKRYAGRVEEFIAGAKARGETIPPRQVVLALLAGQDVLNNSGGGKKAPTPAKPATVDRGKMPPTRTDISGRASASEREKRRQRLTGVNI